MRHITGDRDRLWDPAQLELLARSQLGLGPGAVVVDVGCGTGFLGVALARFFPGGRYIGIDLDGELLRHAWHRVSQARKTDGAVDLPRGFEGAIADAARLPLADAFADGVMCHTVLIHVPDARAVLAEMARVLKPGGRLTAFEPDNTIQLTDTNLLELDADFEGAQRTFLLRVAEGRARQGHGDLRIGPQLPRLMGELGFERVRVRLNHEVDLLQRDRDSSAPRDPATIVREIRAAVSAPPEARKAERDRLRAFYIDGGGTNDSFDRFMANLDARLEAQARALNDLGNAAAVCAHAPLYCVSATKPLAPPAKAVEPRPKPPRKRRAAWGDMDTV